MFCSTHLQPFNHSFIELVEAVAIGRGRHDLESFVYRCNICFINGIDGNHWFWSRLKVEKLEPVYINNLIAKGGFAIDTCLYVWHVAVCVVPRASDED